MLFVVMLGGKHPRAAIEVHDVLFVAAADLAGTYAQLRQGWFGIPKGVHIDSWMAVDGVDQWKVELADLAPAAGEPRLYFLNLGGYAAGTFGEAHRYGLVVACDKAEARLKGRRLMGTGWSQAHTDAVLDVDDCMAIDQVGGRYVQLIEAPHRGIAMGNDYIVLS